MKGNRRNIPPAAPPASNTAISTDVAIPPPTPASPSAKGTAKYTNKDGSKFITVPKTASPTTETYPSAPLSSPVPAAASNSPDTMSAAAPANGSLPPGNRKKAKRRAKAAARERAELAAMTNGSPANGMSKPVAAGHQAPGGSLAIPPEDEIGDSGDDAAASHLSSHRTGEADNHEPPAGTSKAKKSKKKKKKKDSPAAGSAGPLPGELAGSPHVHQGVQSRTSASKEKIWNTNSQEERQRIKEFWLDLSEEERKSLVKVEKDTVLKKMKEQQKMTCSCHFCGRKRTAIEEELEGLYDSYYEELEQFANDPAGQQNGRQPTLMSSTGRFGPSHVLHSPAAPTAYAGHQPSRGRIIDHEGDDEDDDGEDDFIDDDDDDDLVPEDEDSEGDEEDIPPDEIHRDYASDFFNFGNSLQVHGGILTVADDLLKNDGRKFIEMMEQLAERRMAREEDAKDQYGGRGGFPPNLNGGAYGHNHHLPSEEDDYGPEDEDDEDYDSQDEDYDEEEDAMTEEQRMEEGRRMFQIFAARMFEQRVLTAYREKVAKERQQKLLEELADEETQESQRKAKKAKEAQKKKDKAAQKKQALAEEKARKEAEKAAEEAERRALEAQRLEEQRLKAEEKRKKKEAQRKAEEEDRLRKEAERLRRIHEQKERQAEQERKAREAKEREKKLKEEARQKEKEAQEKREKETRERKEKQERDKREKEARARMNEARERQRQEERAALKAAPVPVIPTIPALPTAAPPSGSGATSSTPSAVPTPITLPRRPQQQHQQQHTAPALPQQPSQPSSHSSPRASVVTPALQKGPTPMRPRQSSQHGGSVAGSQSGTASRTASLSGSGQSQNASPNPMTPVQINSGGSVGPVKAQTNTNSFNPSGPAIQNQNLPAFGQATSPLSAPTNSSMQQQTSPFAMAPSPTALHYPLGTAPVTLPPGLGLSSQFAPTGNGAFRAGGPPPMLPMPPGINGIGRGFGPMAPPPGFGHHMQPDPLGTASGLIGSLPPTESGGTVTSHSRQPSGGAFDPGSPPALPTQPIARPAPIGRPGSTVHGQRPGSGSPGENTTAHSGDNNADNSHHLGSRALLDDSDFALDGFSSRRPPVPVSRSTFGAPAPAPFGAVDLTSPFMSQSSLWGSLPSMGSSPFANGPPGFPVGGAAGGLGLGGIGPGGPGSGGWGAPAPPAAFAPHSGSLGRSSNKGRSVMLRQLLCRACKELADPGFSPSAPEAEQGGDHQLLPIELVKGRVNALAQQAFLPHPVPDSELDVLYDTEGNGTNGGGNFDVHRGPDGSVMAIRWLPDPFHAHLQHRFSNDSAGAASVGFNLGENNSSGAVPIGAAPSPSSSR